MSNTSYWEQLKSQATELVEQGTGEIAVVAVVIVRVTPEGDSEVDVTAHGDPDALHGAFIQLGEAGAAALKLNSLN